MSLKERLANPPRPIHGKVCSVGALLDTLTGEDLEALKAMLGSRAWSQAAVWKALTEEGYEVGQQTINKHRGRNCRCFKAAAA